MKSTQTVLSSNEFICEAQDDYHDPTISFKKGEFLKLSTNGHEIQSLETGQKSVVPMKYIGYSMVELLQLFQFALSVLDNDETIESLIQSITKNIDIIHMTRKHMSKQKCKYNNVAIYV